MLTLNLIRPSCINPRLPAEAQLNGAFDFNKTPLAPPGTKVLIFEPSTTRCTWVPHGIQGWYLGTAPKHYRCYHVYFPKTRADRVAKTVQFFLHQCVIPAPSSMDVATLAPKTLANAIPKMPHIPVTALSLVPASNTPKLTTLLPAFPPNMSTSYNRSSAH